MKIEWSPFPNSTNENRYTLSKFTTEKLFSYTSIALAVIIAVVAVLAANGIISITAATTTVYTLAALNLTITGVRIFSSFDKKSSLKHLSIFALCMIATLVIGGLGSGNILSASTMGWAIFGCSFGALTFGRLDCEVSAQRKSVRFQYTLERKPKRLMDRENKFLSHH